VNGVPHLLRQYDGNYLIIQMYLNAMHNPIQAYSQIAHEAIHMLSPCHDDAPVSVLEEGLAYFFTNWYILDRWGANTASSTGELAYFFTNWYILDNFGVMPPQSELPSYDEAIELVDILMGTDGSGIKKMRQEQTTISKISKELIMKYYPTVSEAVAHKLASPFDRG
jgi:hypothetical protein